MILIRPETWWHARAWQWEKQRRQDVTVGLRRRQRGFIINPFAYGAGSGDPYFANVVSLLHFDGADLSTTFTDQTGKTWTRNNTPIISNGQSVFGGASGLFDGGGALDFIYTADHADWAFGSGDFTIEGRVRFASVGGYEGFLSKGGGAYTPFLLARIGTNLNFYATSNGSSWDICNVLTLGTVAIDTWYAFAATRSGTTFYTHLDGVAGATTTSSATLWSTSDVVRIGHYYDAGGTSFGGYLDEVRITKGVARYGASNYTPAASAFPDS